MDETRMPGTTGAGEVHTRIGVGPEPSKGIGMSGKYDAPERGPEQGGGGAMDSARHRAEEVADQVRDRVDDVRDRTNEMVDQTRDRARSAMDQAESRLEGSAVMRMVRENPMLAVGIAFGIGFLLAGSDEEGDKRGGRTDKMKHQIKGALMGGISAAISQELRNMFETQGGLGSLLGMEPQGGRSRGSRPGSRR